MTDAEEMRDLLAYANFTKVSRALGISKTTVSKWAQGVDVNPRRLGQVRDLLRPPAPEPEAPFWVERILASAMLRETREGATELELARAQARAAAYLVAGPQGRRRPAGGAGGGAADA